MDENTMARAKNFIFALNHTMLDTLQQDEEGRWDVSDDVDLPDAMMEILDVIEAGGPDAVSAFYRMYTMYASEYLVHCETMEVNPVERLEYESFQLIDMFK